MGQLRTANKRRNRTITRVQQATKTAAAKPDAAPAAKAVKA